MRVDIAIYLTSLALILILPYEQSLLAPTLHSGHHQNCDACDQAHRQKGTMRENGRRLGW